jgi:hypothetical protein
LNAQYQKIAEALSAVMASDQSLDEKYQQMAKITQTYLAPFSEKERDAFFNDLLQQANTIAGEHALLLKSYIFFYSKNDNALREVASELFEHLDYLDEYHYLIWKIRISLFNFAGQLNPETVHWIKEQCMRKSYLRTLENINACISSTSTVVPPKRIKKVAIVLGQLLGELHAPTRTALMLAMGLMNRYGLDVQIINANFIPLKRTLEYFACTLANYNESLSGKQRFEHNDPEFGSGKLTIYSLPSDFFSLERLVGLWNYLEAEQFDALINLGDVLFATDYFVGKIPVLGIPTAKDLPLSKADQYVLSHQTLTSDEQAIVDQHCRVAPAMGISFNVNPTKTDTCFSKADFALPEDSFVFVVVGNRIAQEIDATFVNICANILNADPKNHIVFVGDFENMQRTLKQNGLSATKRAHSFDFQENLRAFYGLCDVYLNPFRAGGGVSGQAAIAEHLPVVTIADGDVSGVLPSELRCQTPEAFESLALALSEDQALYQTWQIAMQDIAVTRQSNEENIKTIYNLLTHLNDVLLSNSTVAIA